MLDRDALVHTVHLFLAAVSPDSLVRASAFVALEQAYLAQNYTTDLSQAVCLVLSTATPFGSPYALHAVHLDNLRAIAGSPPSGNPDLDLDNICAACGKPNGFHGWRSESCPVGDTTYVPSC